MKPSLRSAALVTAAIIPFCASAPAFAQSAAVKQAYEGSHIVPTNIPGITSFQAPPAGFDPINAADQELAVYGVPPRPDSQAQPEAYAKWAAAMSRPTTRVTGSLTDMHIASTVGRPAPTGPAASLPSEEEAQSSVNYYNWSGVANTIPGLTSWNAQNSFYYVVSEFNVPVAEQAFKSRGGYVCDGGWDYEVSWNGIDGFNNGDVLQGGSLSAAYCDGGSRSTDYCGWVEWYPSYNILCQFAVNPGDDMFVETWDTSSTNGYVYIQDNTLGISGVVHLQPTKLPYLVGNSAEYIVERPCCDNGHYDTLANYVQDFWADNYAYTFAFTLEYPGSTASSTYLINMVNDQDSQIISTAYTAGNYGVVFRDENCAREGGCTP
jgi:Peptidase A4 family